MKIPEHLFPNYMGAHLRLTILEHQSKDGSKRAVGRRTGRSWNYWYVLLDCRQPGFLVNSRVAAHLARWSKRVTRSTLGFTRVRLYSSFQRHPDTFPSQEGTVADPKYR